MGNSSKSLFRSVIFIQIPNFEVSFHSVQYDESIHAPDLRIKFFITNMWQVYTRPTSASDFLYCKFSRFRTFHTYKTCFKRK
jgi:hypothetical protein